MGSPREEHGVVPRGINYIFSKVADLRRDHLVTLRVRPWHQRRQHCRQQAGSPAAAAAEDRSRQAGSTASSLSPAVLCSLSREHQSSAGPADTASCGGFGESLKQQSSRLSARERGKTANWPCLQPGRRRLNMWQPARSTECRVSVAGCRLSTSRFTKMICGTSYARPTPLAQLAPSSSEKIPSEAPTARTACASCCHAG